MRRALSVEAHVQGVREGDRAVLGRTITLIESGRPDHVQKAQAVLSALLPYTGGAARVGISGPPGVGKSTFIERFGLLLCEQGHKVAVLAVDPSSSLTGGSVLGDKTRMQSLSANPSAFIRPSPSAGTLGGVARRTQESMLVLEAAGFDVVLIETVGVGQSETTIREIVDFFVMLTMPGAGDELQGIKRGILEVCDLVAINKSDGERAQAAQLAKAEHTAALRILRGMPKDGWHPPVLCISALHGDGLEDIWTSVQSHRDTLGEALDAQRRAQRLRWTHRLIEERVLERFMRSPEIQRLLPQLERDVDAQLTTPLQAAERALNARSPLPKAPERPPDLSRTQMVEVDRAMMEDLGISLIQMMENAGRHLAHLCRTRFLDSNPRGRRVVVLAGRGGNGGGALVCARRLKGWGALPTVLLSSPPERFSGVPAHQLRILQAMKVPIYAPGETPVLSPELVIDGLIGYSLQGAPRGPAAALIERFTTPPILSLDTPSGVDVTNGQVHSPAVKATATLTLALPKAGLWIAAAQVGELYLADISVPPALYSGPGLGLQVGPIFAESDILRLR